MPTHPEIPTMRLEKYAPKIGDPPESWVYPDWIPPPGVVIPDGEYADLLPKSGFLCDFTRSVEGSEASPFFNLWAGLWLLATTSRRRAYLPWGHGEFYPNLFVLLLSPPGAVHKGVSINHGKKVLKELVAYCKDRDPVEHFYQSTTVLSSKGTPESLNILLKGTSQTFFLPEGGSATLHRGSILDIAVDEFTTFVNRALYNSTLVDKLTNYYDGQDEQMEITVSRKKEVFENIFVNMLSGTTPDHLSYSLPETAYGGGFLSRTIIATQMENHRSVPRPFRITGFPTPSDLAPRLYWCVKNFCGDVLNDALRAAGKISDGKEVTWEPDALTYHDEIFYPQAKLFVKRYMDSSRSVVNRYPQQVLKTAMLLRMADYSPGSAITLDNIRLAEKIIQHTYRSAQQVLNTARADSTSETIKHLIRKYLANDQTLTRRTLMQRLVGRSISGDQLNVLINDLFTEGFLFIQNGDTRNAYSLGLPDETYQIHPDALSLYRKGDT